MSDEMKTTFTPEQISQQAQGNFNGILLVMFAYLKENALSVDEFCAFSGHRFAPGSLPPGGPLHQFPSVTTRLDWADRPIQDLPIS